MIKYKIKLVLWKHDPNEHGHYPIYIRFLINGEKRYIATGHFISSKYWNESNEQVKEGFKDAGLINAETTGKVSAIKLLIISRQLKGESISASEIKQLFSGKANLHNIFDFIDRLIIDLGHKRGAGTIENYKKYSRKLELFAGSRTLYFEDITTDFLQRYENKMREDKLDGNYIWANFKMLKTFFNAARKKGIINFYPFNQYESPEYRQKDKQELTMEDLKKWEELADKSLILVEKQTVCYFLLGCYSGLRISDWFQFDYKKNVVNNRIRLRATKNGEWITMPISDKLKKTLGRIKDLPLTIEEPTINGELKNIAKKLKIKKHITSHSGRHTFAVTICAEHGISSETCAELMGITVATCVNNYYRVSNRKIDKECLKAWKNI